MSALLQAILIGALFAIGFFQLFRRNLIRSLMGMAIIGNGVNLFLLSSGAYNGVVASYTQFTDGKSDALPQALVLTAIVIAMGVFSFVLALILLLSRRYKTADLSQVDRLKH